MGCWFIFHFPMSPAFSQDFKIPKQHIPVINHGFRTLVQVYDGDKRIKNPDNDRFYFWLKAKEIHATEGGYEGDLLHGEYTVFYVSENLKEKGVFHMGLKTGTWKQWHENGEIKEISNWKNGLMSGTITGYDETGKIIYKTHYRRGELDGKQYYYTDSAMVVKKFDNGKERIPKPKRTHGKNKKTEDNVENEVAPEEKTEPVKKERKPFKLFKKKNKQEAPGKPKEEKKSKKTDKAEKV